MSKYGGHPVFVLTRDRLCMTHGVSNINCMLTTSVLEEIVENVLKVLMPQVSKS